MQPPEQLPRPEPQLPDDLRQRPDAEGGRSQAQLQALLDAVLAISRELELPAVLHRIVTTAMDLVDARYGALGVLHESGQYLEAFIVAGLSEEERTALEGLEFPRGRGLLGHLIRHPEPLRVDDMGSHPAAVGFPPNHPRMRTLLGVAVSVRGRIYGDLYLTERRDGRPFDLVDEEVVVALAGAAGIAIDNARLFAQVRDSAEQFQRLLLPTLPDLAPFTGAAVYRPAAAPAHLGGDWYDAAWLPDGAVGIVIGDVVGHDLHAAAAMAATRNMLRALLYDRCTPPSAILTRLDRTLHAITDNPVTTACLARIEPAGGDWQLHWSTAGHLPPLLITPDGGAAYLHADPGIPLGVDPAHPRVDHTHPLPPRTTVVFFTDGLIEHPAHHINQDLNALLQLATEHAEAPLDGLVQALVDHHPSDGHDDMAVLALRTPDTPPVRRTGS
ncbi:PP2C family protein-serine/threonine phosphatase [Streptomyces sp. NPDC057743]|uniref:PP2C family protein-serine/threonine phosphatase n=1 Tax=Streptomyces sp. NPDC057743 TaxID=3346236 RepID=UPI00367CB483